MVNIGRKKRGFGRVTNCSQATSEQRRYNSRSVTRRLSRAGLND